MLCFPYAPARRGARMSQELFSVPMSDANQRVWAQVSGLSREKRERRCLVALQAYIDDSEDAGNLLVLAGYVSDVPSWARFADEWKQILDMRDPYPWPTLHMVSVGDSQQSRERIEWLYRVIERNVSMEVAVCVDLVALKQITQRFRGGITNPYYWAIHGIVNATAQYQRDLGIEEKIDFIFDCRSEAGYIHSAWQHYLSSIPDDVAQLTGAVPRFEDDDEFLPLQAADMLAWHLRKQAKAIRSVCSDDFPFPWENKGQHLVMRVDVAEHAIESHLQKNGLI